MRIDPDTGKPVARSVAILGEEGSFGFGAGAVWALADAGDGARLLALDPDDLQTDDMIRLPFPGSQVVFGSDSVWISSPRGEVVMQVEPTSGRVARTPLPGLSEGAAIASGEGSIWVGTEEALARIDPSSGDVTAMIDEAFTGATGWVTVAFGTVWVRNSTSFLLAIDPTTDQIVKQVDGSSVAGGGSVLGAFDHLWVSAPDSGFVFLLDPEAILHA